MREVSGTAADLASWRRRGSFVTLLFGSRGRALRGARGVLMPRFVRRYFRALLCRDNLTHSLQHELALAR
jgi:hypothetical protein